MVKYKSRREGGREEEREGGREGGRKGGREGGREGVGTLPFIVNNLFSFGQSFGLEAMGDFRSADKDQYSALIRIQLAIETVCVDVCMWMCVCMCV